MNGTDLTPAHVLTVLAGLVFSVPVAAVVGPYILITVAAMGGAAIALLTAESRGRFRAFLYFFGASVLSICMTVPLSLLAANYLQDVPDHLLFAPTAFALGYIGDKWPSVFSWGATKVGTFVDLLIQLRGPK